MDLWQLIPDPQGLRMIMICRDALRTWEWSRKGEHGTWCTYKVIVPLVPETARVGRHSETGTTPMTPTCFASQPLLSPLCVTQKGFAHQ